MTSAFGKRRDLKEVAGKANGVSYEPEQFPGATCKLTELPEITILLSASGKAVIPGIRDLDHLDPTVKQLLRFFGGKRWTAKSSYKKSGVDLEAIFEYVFRLARG